MGMEPSQKRTTIYFDPDLHRALQVEAARSGHSISELVGRAVRDYLTEDALDEAAFELRSGEPDLPFEDVVDDLRRRARI
jgi:predicted transcriptional regulator